MDFLGIGPMELVVIMVIGLLVLGPQRMVNAARGLGRFMREIQRSWHEAVDAVSVEPEPKESSPPQPPPEPSPRGQVAYNPGESVESADPPSSHDSHR